MTIHRAISALLLCCLAGCRPDFAVIRATARIVVADGDIGAEEYALIEQAAREWNAARPRTIGSVSRGSKPRHGIEECDVIYVSRMHVSTECNSMMSSGCTRADGCNAYVLVSRLRADGYDPMGRWLAMIKHEVGHALLGYEHSDVTGSIMSNPFIAQLQSEREITPDEASRVLGAR